VSKAQNATIFINNAQKYSIDVGLYRNFSFFFFLPVARGYEEGERKYVMVQCSVLQCVAVCCSVLQCALPMTLGSKRLPSTPSTKFPALGSDLFSFGVLIVHVLCAYVCPYMCVFAYMYLCLACAMKTYVCMM